MQAPPFFPDELGEWIAAVVTSIALVTSIYRSGQKSQKFEDSLRDVQKDMDVRFKDQGGRIGRVEEGCAANSAELDARTAREAQFSLEVNTNTRELSRVSSELSNLTIAIRSLERHTQEGLSAVRERVVALETENRRKGRGIE